jgi:choline-glycine betaine transporter
MSETAILILLSLPFLLIFAMGIYSLILLLMIDSELEERRKTEEEEIENRK